MFNPSYRVTPFLIKCLEKIASHRVFLDAIGKAALPKINVARDAFNRNVHSSTWIEGNMLSLSQVSALSAKQNVLAEEKQKLEVKNCIKALRWILRSKHRSLTEEKLLKLHALMMQGLLPSARLGRLRSVQNYILGPRGRIIFTPPAAGRVKGAIKNIFLWLKKNSREHTVIRSAIFHHEFVTVHPFVDGNGRVARAASQWILISEGYDPLWTFGLDEYFARDREKYYDMIQQTRDMDGDYTYWIEYVAKGLLSSIEIAVKRVKQEDSRYKKATLTPKQNELIKLIEHYQVIGSAQICQKMKINRSRVNQLIAPLVKAGIVIKEGTTRAVKYRLA